jgi:hypothetical protein
VSVEDTTLERRERTLIDIGPLKHVLGNGCVGHHFILSAKHLVFGVNDDLPSWCVKDSTVVKDGMPLGCRMAIGHNRGFFNQSIITPSGGSCGDDSSLSIGGIIGIVVGVFTVIFIPIAFVVAHRKWASLTGGDASTPSPSLAEMQLRCQNKSRRGSPKEET